MKLGDVIFIGFGPGNVEWNCYREGRDDEEFQRAAAAMRETLRASRVRAGLPTGRDVLQRALYLLDHGR
jgi:hypothetical protein